MREHARRTTVLVLSVLLLAGVVTAPALAGGASAAETGASAMPGASSAVTGPSASATVDASDPATVGPAALLDSSTATAETVRVRNHLRRVEPAGEYGVRTRVEIPDRVVELRIRIPDRATDVSADGFTRENATSWAWDERTERPRLTYRMPANRTVEDGGPLEGDGRYLFVDVGDWAVVNPPQVGVRVQSTGPVRFERENVVAGEGAAGESMAYLGPFEEHVGSANGQRFRLIVPENAELASSPDAILRTLEHASGALRVGDRDAEVFVIAVPTSDVGWGVRGLQSGPADMWVRDAEPVDDATDVWTHEYVHTRQDYRTTASGRWTTEAAATYYAALLALERGDVDFAAFRRILRQGERDPQAGATLSQPATWRNDAHYWKGALVVGEIDRRIRLATDGEDAFTSVLRELNAAEDPVTNEDVLAAVAAAGGSDVRTTARSFTTTDRAPTAWDRDAHDAAFGTLPARIGYSIAGPDAVRVTGEYRDRAVDRDPIRLVVGEALRLRVSVSNDGGTAGDYDLVVRLDGETVATRTGRLAAGETTVETVEHRFEAPGTHDLTVGGQSLRVSVTDPATAAVDDLTVAPETAVRGETVAVTAAVENAASIPAGGSLTLRMNGEAVTTREVRLDAGERSELRFEVTPDESGETTIEIGGERVTLTVTDGGTGSDPGESTADDDTGDDSADPDSEPLPSIEEVPGFGPAAAVIALLLATTLFAARMRRR
ncbi:CARDB domain-containing protein [Halopenitus persicus]|uniref:CARDB domain-containing protein n=1 Tax=Halopenitus persicus TaxID=1048396 RepID=UPI000BBADDE2|nr:CARDB domain-containing protein [Halopenitus persicus]